jgi:geranylgeranyl diphosphate synthase type II
MDFVDAYKNILDKIENRITEFVPGMEPRNLYDPFSYIMQGGGKRLRPALCMISAGAAGCEPEKSLDCGVALEILHNFTLVHDDIMDQSPIRRGRETIHKKWDEPTAILTGDIMVGYAFRLLPIAKKHPRSAEIFKIFTDELIEVCEGAGIRYGIQQPEGCHYR